MRSINCLVPCMKSPKRKINFDVMATSVAAQRHAVTDPNTYVTVHKGNRWTQEIKETMRSRLQNPPFQRTLSAKTACKREPGKLKPEGQDCQAMFTTE
eukprot:6465680-Amphidinium_carterae.1